MTMPPIAYCETIAAFNESACNNNAVEKKKNNNNMKKNNNKNRNKVQKEIEGASKTNSKDVKAEDRFEKLHE